MDFAYDTDELLLVLSKMKKIYFSELKFKELSATGKTFIAQNYTLKCPFKIYIWSW